MISICPILCLGFLTPANYTRSRIVMRVGSKVVSMPSDDAAYCKTAIRVYLSSFLEGTAVSGIGYSGAPINLKGYSESSN